MAETLLEFDAPVSSADGVKYRARAIGAELPGGTWQGWIEFVHPGQGEAVRTGRETTQPNHADAVYWATGLTYVYLEGALKRALSPTRIVPPPLPDPPVFDEPALPVAPLAPTAAPGESVEAVLDPFAVYQSGETQLRQRLGALSPWHLVNIIAAYELSDESAGSLSRMPAAALIDLIVRAVAAGASATRAR